MRDVAPHVLVLSTAVDPATDAVLNCLDRRGTRVTRVDTENYPYQHGSSLFVSDEGVYAGWGKIGSIWYRRIRSPVKPEAMDSAVHDYCCHEAQGFLVGSALAMRVPAMSDPARVWAAENKLFQLRMAVEVGLSVPKTVVTNEPATIKDFFFDTGSAMVVKPLRSGYIEIGGEDRAVFTNRVLKRHLDQVDSAALCPAIYQEFVDKICDVRVTAVGEKLFVAEIDSQSDPEAAVDWRRTSNPRLPHRAATLPDDLAARVRTLMQRLGLAFGALDFVRSASGEYFFLEVNPNGQWLWLEDFLDFPIAETVADWLSEKASGA
jgi:glutathione synthase/RimK-type ligase-like ATP-grasp enzyme